jgi:hypothetical protein
MGTCGKGGCNTPSTVQHSIQQQSDSQLHYLVQELGPAGLSPGLIDAADGVGGVTGGRGRREQRADLARLGKYQGAGWPRVVVLVVISTACHVTGMGRGNQPLVVDDGQGRAASAMNQAVHGRIRNLSTHSLFHSPSAM